MALTQRDFRKDKPKPLRVRTVGSVKILALFERTVRMKKVISLVLVLAVITGLSPGIAEAQLVACVGICEISS